MESAFGVDHGEVAKSYKKLAPKLNRVMEKPGIWTKNASIDERIRANYALARTHIGQQAGRNWAYSSSKKSWEEVPKVGKKPAPAVLAGLKADKDLMDAMRLASRNRSKRNRRLP